MIELLGKAGRRLADFMGSPKIGADEKFLHRNRVKEEVFGFDTLSPLMPYEYFDQDLGLFKSSEGVGFVVEAVPLVGGDDHTQKELGGLLDEILEEGVSIQCLLLADHKIDHYMRNHAMIRASHGELYYEIMKQRTKYFRDTKNTSPRFYRFIISVSIKEQMTPHVCKRIQEKKERLLKSLRSLTYAETWNATDFITTVGSLINFDLSSVPEIRKVNPYETLSSQLPKGGALSVEENRLLWKKDQEVSFKSFRAVDYPDYWHLNLMGQLIGDAIKEGYKINTPFFIQYAIHCPNQNSEEKSFGIKSQLIEKQGQSSVLRRMIPQLEDELQECYHIRHALSEGSKFVWTQLSTGFWSDPKDSSQIEQTLKSLYRMNGFKLSDNVHVHLPHYFGIIPMSWAEYVKDFKDLSVLRTTLSLECPSFIPLQGEWYGTDSPGMVLLGRRGQLLNFNPFDNKGGNYNCIVVGRSGSGKSVFMQELLMNGLGTGAKVFVLDVGRSFEKMSDMVEGQKIEFGKGKNVCINPFTHISTDPEERSASFSFLKSVISCMAAPSKGTSDFENAIIEKAIAAVWEKKKNKATITDIAEFLSLHKEPLANNLSIMLTPYIKGGIYSSYFDGEANVNFKNSMVLIELEELKEKKDLQAVILQLFIMEITNQAFLGDRKTPFYICIDEAWDLLRAKQTGPFIETLARRLRKYHGSLVIGTQSVEDFFSCPGAEAAYHNSDWMCLLSQKPSSIAKLTERGDFDQSKAATLKTVNTRHGEYSEIMICSSDGYSVGRLVLDPFSQLLYSTKADEYAKIKELTSRGLSVKEAIQTIVLKKESGA